MRARCVSKLKQNEIWSFLFVHIVINKYESEVKPELLLWLVEFGCTLSCIVFINYA